MEGHLDLTFRVDASGMVEVATAHRTGYLDDAVARCVLEVSRAARFEPPSGGRANIKVPVTFIPPGAKSDESRRTVRAFAPVPPSGAQPVATWTFAADRTSDARQVFQRAIREQDESQQRSLVRQAVAEYQGAAAAWRTVMPESRIRAEEAGFWLADAEYWVVVLKVAFGEQPTPAEQDAARRDARAVLYSNGGPGAYRQAVAYYLISIADKLLEHSEATPGQVTPPVEAAVAARDEYVAMHFSPSNTRGIGQLGGDGNMNARYAYEAAALLLSHGARDGGLVRFQRVYATECNRTDWGERARQQLVAASAGSGLVPCALTGRQ